MIKRDLTTTTSERSFHLIDFPLIPGSYFLSNRSIISLIMRWYVLIKHVQFERLTNALFYRENSTILQVAFEWE